MHSTCISYYAIIGIIQNRKKKKEEKKAMCTRKKRETDEHEETLKWNASKGGGKILIAISLKKKILKIFQKFKLTKFEMIKNIFVCQSGEQNRDEEKEQSL